MRTDRIKPIKVDLTRGEFIVRLPTQITEVIDEIVERLKTEFAEQIEGIWHLVPYRSHAEYAALVVAPRTDRPDRSYLPGRVDRVVEVAMRQQGQARMVDRAAS